VEQIVGETSDEKPCIISRKPMAARLAPFLFFTLSNKI